MIATDIGQMMLLTLLILFEISGGWHDSMLWPILISVFLCKTLAVMFETVSTFHLVPSLVKGEDLTEANSWFFSSNRLMEILGPLVGGLLVTAFGFRSTIIVNIASFSATLFFVIRMRELSTLLSQSAFPKKSRPKASVQLLYKNFINSVRFIWSNAVFRGIVLMMFFWNLTSLSPTSTTVTYFFNGLHQFKPADYGAVMAMFGMFSIAGFLVSSQLYAKFGFSKTITGAALWQAFFGSLAAVFAHFPMIFVVLLATARAGSSTMAMGTFLVRQTETPKGKSGSINSALRMMFMSSAPISSGLQGNLIQSVGVLSSFIFGGAALWLTYLFSKRTAEAFEIRHSRKPSAPPKAA
jgi:MFS family permease